MNIAIVGATGVVGRKMIFVLNERRIPIDECALFASEKSYGQTFSVAGKLCKVNALNELSPSLFKFDYALFSAGAEVSEKFAPSFARAGAVVIDNSRAFRQDENVPLVVPCVNGEDIFFNHGIIANPNCSTIQAVTVLKPLHSVFGIKRVVYTTFQAVSGAGRRGIDDLKNGVLGRKNEFFPTPIFSNCIPHIDSFLPDGYTREERKMIDETRKILHLPDLNVTATCVRVPVFNCHSESVNVTFEKSFTLKDIYDVLQSAPNVKLYRGNDYPTAVDADGKDEVFVGRVRLDGSEKNSINFWCVADNLLCGAAANAVSILEKLAAGKRL